MTSKLSPPEPLPSLPDPRRNVYRPDLAADDLHGRVNAPKYVTGIRAQAGWPQIPLRKTPEASAGLETEVLFGETVQIYDEYNEWAWVQLARDRYVGYVPRDALQRDVFDPTHRISALGTFAYPEPDIKTPPLMHLPLNALVSVASEDEKFASITTGGFVIKRHLTEMRRFTRDFVDVVERLIGTPYLWGGRTRIGIDCSGLVQTSLQAAGTPCPRDSDMQEAELGMALDFTPDLEGLTRGDLIFWKGHTGIMADGIMLVHANAFHMQVVVEPLPEAAQRIARNGAGAITSVKRLGAVPASS